MSSHSCCKMKSSNNFITTKVTAKNEKISPKPSVYNLAHSDCFSLICHVSCRIFTRQDKFQIHSPSQYFNLL